MKITRRNFNRLLPQILEYISKADLVAIDTELTGLRAVQELGGFKWDSSDSRYSRLRDACGKLQILQYGISTFTYEQGAVVARPMSFYLHPRAFEAGLSVDWAAGTGGDSAAVFQPESLKFLSENNFDFNLTFGEGLSFLSRWAEAKIRREQRAEKLSTFLLREEDPNLLVTRLVTPNASYPRKSKVLGADEAMVDDAPATGAEGSAAPAPKEIKINAPDDAEWLEGMSNKLDEWIASVRAWYSGAGGAAAGAPAPPLESVPLLDADGRYTGNNAAYPYFITEPLNGARRFWVRVLVAQQLGGDLAVVVKKGEDQGAAPLPEGAAPDTPAPAPPPFWAERLRLVYVGPQTPGPRTYEQQALLSAVAELDALVDEAVGMRRVVDAITAAKVPVIGHNCYMDLVHSTVKFVGPAPMSLPAWASQLRSLFPLVFDTKALINTPPPPSLAESGAQTPHLAIPTAFFRNDSLEKAFGVVSDAAGAPATTFLPVGSPVAVAQAAAEAKKAAEAAAAAAAEAAEIEAAAAAAAAVVAPATDAGNAAEAPAVAAAPAAAVPAPAPRGGRRPFRPRPGPNGAPVEEKVPVKFNVNFADLVPIKLVVESGEEGAPPVADASATNEAHQAHDAGYDAYMTGVVLLRVAAVLAGAKFDPAWTAGPPPPPPPAEAAPLAEGSAPPPPPPAPAPTITVAPDVLDVKSIELNPAQLLAAVKMAAALGPNGEHLPGAAAAAAAADPAVVAAARTLRAYGNRLFQMTMEDRELAVLSLDDAAALHDAGRGAAAAPDPATYPSDTSNSLLTQRAKTDRSRILVLTKVVPALSDDAIITQLAAVLGISASLFKRNEDIAHPRPCKSVAFVRLPTAAHVEQALLALEASKAKEEEQRVAPPVNVLGLLPGGDNMLGLPFVTHDLAADGVAEEAAEAAAAAAASASGSSGGAAGEPPAKRPRLALPDAIPAPPPAEAAAAARTAALARLIGLDPSALAVRLHHAGPMSYAEYLASMPDVFGDTCAHEFKGPQAPPPLAGTSVSAAEGSAPGPACSPITRVVDAIGSAAKSLLGGFLK